MHAAHFLVGILVVRVRLEARIRAHKGANALTADYLALRREAVFVQGVIAVGAIGLAVFSHPLYASALALSSTVHFHGLYTAHTAEAISLPMAGVGRRALAVSIVFTLLMIAGAVRGE